MLLTGARQVGKTYLLTEFGKNEYTNVIYCNFEQEQNLKSLFDSFDGDKILKSLSYIKKKEILEYKDD